MQLFADLHNHSKYSRATSKDMDLEHQTRYGKIKGLNILGSGDATHPLWVKELKTKLKDEGSGIYEYNGMNWVLSSEISNIYSTQDGVKKIHHVLLFPNFEIVDQVNELLSKKGNLMADGRPIFGKYPSQELVQDLMNINKDIEVIPAHVWTPWFSLFGSNSGYNSIKDCYGTQVKNIHCLETGLSSDPKMNWRVSQTHKMTLVSNSDSHSPHPWRIGRECNALSLKELNYESLINTLRTNSLDFTIEVSPSYGKYHFDGHRACNVCMHPESSKKLANTCPKCNRKLTIGVLSRVLELADKPDGFMPEGATPFKTLLPLAELIRTSLGISSLNSKKVIEAYYETVKHFDNEFNILLNVSYKDLEEKLGKKLSKAILLNRSGKILYNPVGYDGVYGEPVLDGDENLIENNKNEKSLKDFF